MICIYKMFLLHSFLTVDLPGHPGLTNLDQLLSEFFFFKKKKLSSNVKFYPHTTQTFKKIQRRRKFSREKKMARRLLSKLAFHAVSAEIDDRTTALTTRATTFVSSFNKAATKSLITSPDLSSSPPSLSVFSFFLLSRICYVLYVLGLNCAVLRSHEARRPASFVWLFEKNCCIYGGIQES